ncbi:hypothetical protein B0H13DRAFT_1904692 [Mycena leptocephala]|nr:hypothetical protein B0H13DRAFT_1904692 [Mycena leptocephala]
MNLRKKSSVGGPHPGMECSQTIFQPLKNPQRYSVLEERRSNHENIFSGNIVPNIGKPATNIRNLQPIGMTIDPAYASITESELGSLEAGKRADFVVLSQDIMRIPAHEILETTVLMTVLDGKAVYEAL